MSRLNILVVGIEKELGDFEESVEACRKTVGNMKIYSAHRAVDAVSKLGQCVQQCGRCHGVLLHNQFTAKGKEEYSDLIKKLLRDKHPDVPIICWGVLKKGGEAGKDYHYGLEWKPADGPAPVAKVLTMLKNGEIVPEYHGKKGRKSVDETRKSMDVQPSQGSVVTRRNSIEGGSAPQTAAGAVTPKAAEGSRPSRKSLEGSEGKGTNSPRGVISPKTRATAASPRASIDVRAAASPRSSVEVPRGAMASGGSFAGMLPMGGMIPMTGMGMQPMTGMSPMTPMTPMNLTGPMAPTAAMTPMTPMTPMMTPMTPMLNSTPMMGAGSGLGILPSYTAGMGMGMSMGGMAAQAPMPAAPQLVVTPAPSANVGLIQALAEEVTRLKLLVEEKRLRESLAAAVQGPVPVATHPLSEPSSMVTGGGLSMGVVGLESSMRIGAVSFTA